MDIDSIYPIKFKPILQEKVWGGEKLISKFHKKSSSKNIGESWELSGIDHFVSVVDNGKLKGFTITDLMKEFTSSFLGQKVYEVFGDEFPLLFKFIDANENLSIQLHPNDQIAKERHNSFGKTEMWYVIDADQQSNLYAGFKNKMDKSSYLNAFEKGKLLDVIYVDEVAKGDAFFIESGTIHAIGKGVVVAEIQQTSDITYRVYDWDRQDALGSKRELHTNEALEALDFSKFGSCKLKYTKEVNKINKIFSCEYFTTNKISVTHRLNREVKNIDSFIVYMCVSGEGNIMINEKKETLGIGETILVPALSEKVILNTLSVFEVLEVYI